MWLLSYSAFRVSCFSVWYHAMKLSVAWWQNRRLTTFITFLFKYSFVIGALYMSSYFSQLRTIQFKLARRTQRQHKTLNHFGTMIWGFVINPYSSSPIFKSLDLSILVITILVFEKEGVYLKSRILNKTALLAVHTLHNEHKV